MVSTNLFLKNIARKAKLDKLKGVHKLGMSFDVLDNIIFILGDSQKLNNSVELLELIHIVGK